MGTAHITENMNLHRDTFLKTFNRAMAGSNYSRHPKMEFFGTLISLQDAASKGRFSYALKTKMNKYFLKIDGSLASKARCLEGKEVLVRGSFDFDSFSIAVEEISASPKTSSISPAPLD